MSELLKHPRAMAGCVLAAMSLLFFAVSVASLVAAVAVSWKYSMCGQCSERA